MLGLEGNKEDQFRKMPFCRTRRPHLSSVTQTQVEVEGTTFLCFPTDHSWFKGTIVNSEDEDQSYSIYGERLQEIPNNNNKGEEETSHSYVVTLTDHFTGLTHALPIIYLHPKSTNNLLSCAQDAQVKFKIDQVYKGMKADMMIQQYGGSSSLVGQNCLVYSGSISLLFSDDDTGSKTRNWCL